MAGRPSTPWARRAARPPATRRDSVAFGPAPCTPGPAPAPIASASLSSAVSAWTSASAGGGSCLRSPEKLIALAVEFLVRLDMRALWGRLPLRHGELAADLLQPDLNARPRLQDERIRVVPEAVCQGEKLGRVVGSRQPLDCLTRGTV